MNTIAILGTLVLLGAMIYGGIRDGAFFSLYSLLRNLFGFLLAMTLADPLANLVLMFGEGLKLHPGPLYWRAIAFATVFAVVFAGARWLKIRFTPANVPTYVWVDRIVGGGCGMFNAIVVVGALLILWSTMPFAKFIPGDFGRIETDTGILFPGRTMLRFYSFTRGRMRGGRKFLLEQEPVVDDQDGDDEFDVDGVEGFEDLNNNGKWDRGWLWRYKSHADFRLQDMTNAASIRKPIPKQELPDEDDSF